MKLERQDHLAMTAIVFDSLSMMKRLRGTGLTEEQSVAIIDVTRDSLASFATKDDVEQAVQRGIQGLDPKFASIDQRFSEVDKRFNEVDKRFNEIDRHLGQIDQRFIILEQRMTIKLGTIVVVALGAFTALSKWIA
jgi:septation ring formation regulator EzrA